MYQRLSRRKPEAGIVGCRGGPNRLTVPHLRDPPNPKMMALVNGVQGLFEDERGWPSVEQECGNWGFRIAPVFCQSPDHFVVGGRVTVVRQPPSCGSKCFQKLGAGAQKDKACQVRRCILGLRASA